MQSGVAIVCDIAVNRALLRRLWRGGSVVDVHRQPRFVARRGVAVQDAFVDRFIYRRNGFGQQRLRRLPVVRGEGGAEFLDRGTKTAAMAAID